ncbi:hypothetical protein NW768_001312 [Fusarium equiseti]|uniref:Uncharacterized protein n=1 Tax=Fusarium equiseti TaxID=61235 RepID=A0ABQ8RQ39_FUSEQ|nr:hypothetical protein NW768_001312 [Fusarium equiseti]
MVSRCPNPNRRPNDRRETERSILLPPLIDEIRPTSSERRRVERDVNARRRRTRRGRVQRPPLTPRTDPTIPTRPLTPSSSEGLINIVRSSQDPIIPRNYTPDRQAHVPFEPDDSIQEPYEVEHEPFTTTPPGAAPEPYRQNSSPAFAPSTIDFDIPSVDEGYVLLEPGAAVYQADARIPSTVRDLALNSPREYEDLFMPRNMNQTQFEHHLEEISREVQRRIPLPDLDPNADDFSVRLTFENGYACHDMVYFNHNLKYSFISYDYLWRIRTASGRLPYVIEAPPIHRETLTPNGVLAPIKYLLYADLDWESSGLPFPQSQLYFIIYRGNGTIYDTKPVLGRNWSEMVERQAPIGA